MKKSYFLFIAMSFSLFLSAQIELEIEGEAKVEELTINDEYTLPKVDGILNQVLLTDGNGNISWSFPVADDDWTVNGSDVYRASGSVGIGLNNPSELLHISGGTEANIRLEAPDNKYLRFYEAGSLKGLIGHSGTSLNIRNYATGGDVNFGADGSNDMTIETGGEVGIGTSNPQEDLHISKDLTADIRLEASGSKYLRFYESGIEKAYVGHTGTGMYMMNLEDNGNMRFGVEGLTAMTILPNRRVGIGTTNPNDELHINGGAEADIQLEASGSKYLRFYESGIEKGYMGHSGTNLNLINLETGGDLRLGVNGNTDMTIESGGEVGIRTTSPEDDLHINGGSSCNIRLEATSGKSLRFYEGSNYSGYMGHGGTDMSMFNFETGGDMHFGTDAAFRLTIASDGEVGIGTTDPLDLLHVDGVVRIGSAERLFDGGVNRLDIEAHFRPSLDDNYDLGSSTNRWEDVFATNGTINTSDARDKTKIENLNYGLESVMKLRPVSFLWKNDLRGEAKLGLIAQELLEVIPEVVKTHDEVIIDEETGETEVQEVERLGVYYSDLIPVLIKSIQELNEEFTEKLEAKDKELEELKASFEARLARIEAGL